MNTAPEVEVPIENRPDEFFSIELQEGQTEFVESPNICDEKFLLESIDNICDSEEWRLVADKIVFFADKFRERAESHIETPTLDNGASLDWVIFVKLMGNGSNDDAS